MSFIVVKGDCAARRRRPHGFDFASHRASPPSEYLMRWEAHAGAQKFASMNGGKVTTELEFFYAPRLTAA